MNMDIVITPELYYPVVDSEGNYVDTCPKYIKYGIRCPCGSRADKIYETRSKFKAHLNCLTHKIWIVNLNNSRANINKQNIELDELVKNQREIIKKQENEIFRLKTINAYIENKLFTLEQQPEKNNVNMLELD